MGEVVYKFEAFSFTGICQTVALSLCPLVGQANGVEPVCYSRNTDLGGNIIFQPGKITFNCISPLFLFIIISYTGY